MTIIHIKRKEAVMRLEGKVALITGGNSGIGFATAQQFVKEGAYVFITGRSQTKLDEAVKRVGSNVTGVQGDVSKLEDLDRLFAQIKKEKGRLNIVFANAGIAKYAPLGAIDEAHYDSIFDGNVKGMLYTVQKALHIRVNAISPGPIDTEGLRELFGSSPTGQERLKSISSTVPLGRLGKPEEIAKAAVFLASEDSSFITGVELFVDGGFAQV